MACHHVLHTHVLPFYVRTTFATAVEISQTMKREEEGRQDDDENCAKRHQGNSCDEATVKSIPVNFSSLANSKKTLLTYTARNFAKSTSSENLCFTSVVPCSDSQFARSLWPSRPYFTSSYLVH